MHNLLGVGIGLLAPSVMLGPMAWKGNPELLLILLLTGFGGGVMGAMVGTVLLALAAAIRGRVVALAFAGVPVGAFAGLGVGLFVGGLIDTAQVGPLVATLGFLVGGPTLGVAWLPYLALKHVGRSGLPAVVIGIVCAPIMAGFALLSAAFVFNF